ncbi:sigma-E factor negative regulatory protein RseA [Vibrio xiamenensis]|uniref:Anti-sigma-E factor RseA n=2 Tax=Vibrio xiamenensis TaxID=861298 RepID=A0A1G7VWN6_9VIBR|nr:sigma-E factor negative regulatory protein RseA [Vibrio xiamenensis]
MVKIMADKEKLSALMDGELVDKALISELSQDQESLQVWKDYHLIGDVMRGEAPANLEWNIAESVALALENEPAHSLVDRANVTHLRDAITESQPEPQKARRQLPTWLTQFGQVAVAACVTLAVIVGVQQYGGDGTAPDGSNDKLPVLQTVPFAGSAEPVSLTRESVERQVNEVNVQEQRRRISAMLQDYELQLRLNSGDTEHQMVDPEAVVE